MLLAIIAARLVFNRALSSRMDALAARRARDASHADGRKLLEECWVTLGNLLMLGAAVWVMLNRCARGSKSGGGWCVSGWGGGGEGAAQLGARGGRLCARSRSRTLAPATPSPCPPQERRVLVGQHFCLRSRLAQQQGGPSGE